MPRYSLGKEQKPTQQGIMPCSIQHHRFVSLSNDMEELTRMVGMHEAFSGKFLVSNSFGSCVGVVARFKSEAPLCYLFHSVESILPKKPDPADEKNYETTRIQFEYYEAMKKKIKLAEKKDELIDVVAIGKSNTENNKVRASKLAFNLTVDLRHPVKLVEVPGYSSVLADGFTNQIILSRNQIRLDRDLTIPELKDQQTDESLPGTEIKNRLEIAIILERAKKKKPPIMEESLAEFEKIIINDHYKTMVDYTFKIQKILEQQPLQTSQREMELLLLESNEKIANARRDLGDLLKSNPKLNSANLNEALEFIETRTKLLQKIMNTPQHESTASMLASFGGRGNSSVSESSAAAAAPSEAEAPKKEKEQAPESAVDPTAPRRKSF